VREELGLVYSIQAINGPGRAYADSGLFFSGAPCAPDKVDEVLGAVAATFQAFADAGPKAAELDDAKKQIRNHLDTQLKDPEYWFGQLATLDLHHTKLADLRHIPEAYEALTAEQIQGTFKKYDQPVRTFHVSAVPTKTPATSAPGQ
jgi:predicted Zn-dependent peptidase